MHNKLIPVLVGIVIIVGVGSVVYWQQGQEKAAAPAAQENSPSGSTYTLSEVATHSSASDCWAVINGGIYNLTSWIPRHPGGERAIEGLCGKDGSAAFNAQHGGGAAQEAVLAGLKIGVVKE